MTRRALVLGLSSILFLAAIVAGLVQIGKASLETGGANQAAALLAARNQAVAFYTLDPSRAEEQVDEVIAGAAGEFLTTYSAQRDLLIKNVRAREQVVTAAVPTDGTAIAHFTDEQAVVLVAIDVTARQDGSPQTTPYRVRLTMERIEGVWKSSTLDTLEAESGPGLYIPGVLPGGNDEILSAAAKASEVMYSYDYRTPELRAFEPLVTDRFRPIFERTYASNSSAAVTKLSVVESYARAVGLVVRDRDMARALVYLDQVVTVAGKANPVGTRLFVDLIRVEGRWLVDGLAAP